jgi:hypothetical protein
MFSTSTLIPHWLGAKKTDTNVPTGSLTFDSCWGPCFSTEQWETTRYTYSSPLRMCLQVASGALLNNLELKWEVRTSKCTPVKRHALRITVQKYSLYGRKPEGILNLKLYYIFEDNIKFIGTYYLKSKLYPVIWMFSASTIHEQTLVKIKNWLSWCRKEICTYLFLWNCLEKSSLGKLRNKWSWSINVLWEDEKWCSDIEGTHSCFGFPIFLTLLLLWIVAVADMSLECFPQCLKVAKSNERQEKKLSTTARHNRHVHMRRYLFSIASRNANNENILENAGENVFAFLI